MYESLCFAFKSVGPYQLQWPMMVVLCGQAALIQSRQLDMVWGAVGGARISASEVSGWALFVFSAGAESKF